MNKYLVLDFDLSALEESSYHYTSSHGHQCTATGLDLVELRTRLAVIICHIKLIYIAVIITIILILQIVY